MTPEQLEIQRTEQGKICAQSDAVITTAKLFGRPAPILIKADVIAQMKHGSVIVDLAADTGGNVEGTVLGEEKVTDNGRSRLSEPEISKARFPSMLRRFSDRILPT